MTVSLLMLAASFGGSLFSQNVDAIGRTFDQSDQSLSFALALTRIGALFALLASALADRKGRRLMLLISVGGICVGNAISAVAPSMTTFTVGQIISRGFLNSVGVIAVIVVIEESPTQARAFALGIFTLVSGIGYSLGLALLPINDLALHAWRFTFGASALFALALPMAARRLRDTQRYIDLAARTDERGRPQELVDNRYGRRFALIALVGFLLNIFAAPSAQLTNRYLASERDFSSLGITLFRATSGGIPGALGVLLGGRLAETKGRRVVAMWALLLSTIAEIAFFLLTGTGMWMVATIAILFAAISGPALGTFSAELFPTEVRGTANGFLITTGVIGSAVGLALAGLLSDVFDSLGQALAVLGIASIVVTLLIPLLPEAKGRPLEDVSPSEV